MKNKLLSTVCIAILSSLSTQSVAIANNYQDAINAPYNYPEHRHEDNRNIIDLENDKKFNEHVNQYIKIADIMTPVIDVISYATETTSPLIKKIPELNIHYDSTDFDLPSIPNYPQESILRTTIIHLEDKLADHDHQIGSLNMSINNLNKKNNDQDKSNSENRAETINSIQNVKDDLSNVERKLNDSEIKNKKYVDDAVSKNEAMATLLINDVNKLHEEDTQQLNVAIKKAEHLAYTTVQTNQFSI